jgi:hypothetical protein
MGEISSDLICMSMSRCAGIPLVSSNHPIFFSVCTHSQIIYFTLWSYWKWPFIDGLPTKNGGSFHGYVKLPEGIFQFFPVKIWRISQEPMFWVSWTTLVFGARVTRRCWWVRRSQWSEPFDRKACDIRRETRCKVPMKMVKHIGV